tara:strand:- start:138 stop:497 length:360 start_codon:yes stop_codon:yes gene_type:complete
MNISQDWDPVIWNKSKPKSSNDAVQRGYTTTSVSKKNPSFSRLKKIDTEELNVIPCIKKNTAQIIQKSRLSKKMTQKELANKINEKPQIISSYESGKAKPKPEILQKIRRVLEIKGKLL